MRVNYKPILIFIKEIAIFSLICCVAASVALALYYPTLTSKVKTQLMGNMLYSLRDREADLTKENTRPRLIIVGGSNGCFGFDSKAISDSLNLDVINTSLHAGLGLQFQMQFITPYIKERDIILLTPEYEQFFNNNYFGNEALASAIICLYPDKYRDLSLAQQKNAILGMLTLTKNKLKPFQNGEEEDNRVGGGVFAYQAINKFGDAINHYNKENLIFTPYQHIDGDINKVVISEIMDFSDLCTRKGVSVLLLPPVLQETSSQNMRENIALVNEEMRKNQLSYIAPSIRYCFEDSLFFNSPYHCNRKGVEKRTQYAIDDIRKHLQNQKKQY